MSAPVKADFENIKRARQKDGNVGQELMNQIEHVRQAGARLNMSEVLVPGVVVTADTSAAPVKVYVGVLCRIAVSADTYVAFGNFDLDAVTSASSPGLLLPANGVYLVASIGDYIRTSAAVARLEIIAQDPNYSIV